MPQYDYPSRYYADDKDVADLLSQPKFSSPKLLLIARKRGVFLSPALPKESLIEYLSRLPFSWPDLIELIKSIETNEKESDTAPVRIASVATLEEFQVAAKQVQEIRGQLNSEVYSIRQTSDGAIITVKHREIDPRSTRTLQWTDHTIEIHAHKTDEGFEVKYAATDRGQKIVDKIIESLPTRNDVQTRLDAISLRGIVSSDKRTKFFHSLIYGMNNLRPENIKDLRLNRVTIDASGETKVETEGLTLDTEDAPENNPETGVRRLKRTTLSGDSLFQDPHFIALCKDNFFVTKALWVSVEKEGKGRRFEFEAEFKDAETCEKFTYRLRGTWERDEDGELVLKKSAVGLADRKYLGDALIASAYNALVGALTLQSLPVKQTDNVGVTQDAV